MPEPPIDVEAHTRRCDALFQRTLTALSTGFGFFWTGEPCTVGISTAPCTRRPVHYAGVRAPESRGGGRDSKQNDRTLAERRTPWTGADADDEWL